MPNSLTAQDATIVVSALTARSNFGKLLDRVDREGRSPVSKGAALQKPSC
ncbi:MAG TPA: hypothetical protein VGD64_11305 [Acidisarcina sp.]